MPSNAADRDALRASLVAAVPRWYSPWAHLAFPSLFAALVVGLCLGALQDLRAIELLTVPAVLVISNAVEWRVHRDLLHRRAPLLGELYERHTPQHHRVFVTDDMAIRGPREFRLVLIPFYGIVTVVAFDLLLALGMRRAGMGNVAPLFLATSACYVVSYEMLHLAYHLPEEGLIGRRWLIRALRRHHAIHHAPALMQRWNFNVTVPLWDRVRGTTFRGPVPPAGDERTAG